MCHMLPVGLFCLRTPGMGVRGVGVFLFRSNKKNTSLFCSVPPGSRRVCSRLHKFKNS